MGQTVGKASFDETATPFVNLPAKAIAGIWETYNIVADAWGLDESLFAEVVASADDGASDFAASAKAFFALLDSDKNGLVDALEAMCAMALTSGLSDTDKLTFVFNCYDFDQGGRLTVDEMTLAMKSTVAGLCKMIGQSSPELGQFEAIAALAFERSEASADSKISLNDFIRYTKANPVISSWIAYFDDLEDALAKPAEAEEGETAGDPSDVEEEGEVVARSDLAEAHNNLETAEMEMAFQMADDAGGDEFMATKPWLGTIANTVPSEPPATLPADSAPDTDAVLEWVHGYRSQDTRNNLRYGADGSIIYHAAGVGIVYRKGEEGATDTATQNFNLEHTDDICSFAISPCGRYVATGEMGRSPKIVVWDAATCATLSILKGFHKRAVTQLDFSADSSLLLSVGRDSDNSVAVYDWRDRKKIFSSKNDKNKVLDAKWNSDTSGGGSTFATSGTRAVYFWSRSGSANARFGRKKGLFGRKGKIQAVMSLSQFGDDGSFVSGQADGSIYRWEGRNCASVVNKAHTGSVSALHFQSARSTLVSGGKDGKVKLWSASLEPQGILDMFAVSASHFQRVRSVCLSDDGTRCLVGTMGSEIFELSAIERPEGSDDGPELAIGQDLNGGALVSGHFKHELWGLAVHPSGGEFATCGDDRTVRTWDATTHKEKGFMELNGPARCLAYSPDGARIAVGMGGRVGRGGYEKDGAVTVLTSGAEGLAVETELHHAKEWSQDIKFSPDGNTLALGSHDNSIYLYNTQDWAQAPRVCSAHNSFVTHFDFSADGAFIQSNCGAYELLYFSVETGEQHTNLDEVKDQKWASQSCVLGWSVQGIWPPFADGTDVNTVDRNTGENLLATADDFGKLKILNWPCPEARAAGKEYRGHSSHVTNVRWADGDTRLITTGGNDRCVFQWSTTVDEAVDSAQEEGEGGEDAEAGEDDEEAKVVEVESGSDEDLRPSASAKMQRSDAQDARMADDLSALFAMEESAGGDEFMAIKPWLGAIVGPSVPPTDSTGVPDDDLELQWVHGYRAQDARSNLHYNADGDIVYSTAATGIVLNKAAWTQRFNHDHTDDVICLAMHPDRVHVATGQMGRSPTVTVWDTRTGETVRVLKAGRVRAICQLAFSPDGNLLAGVGQDDNHTVTVWNWRDGHVRSRGKTGGQKVLALAFSADSGTLLTAGNKSFKVWTLRGRNMSAKRGLFGSSAKIQPIVSSAFVRTGNEEDPNECFAVMGAHDGNLYKLDPNGRKVGSVVEAHAGSVNCMHVCTGPEGGDILLTGGRDGLVKVWDAELNEMQSFNVGDKDKFPGVKKAEVRSVCLSRDGSKILVGTRGSEIVEVRRQDGSDVNSDNGNGGPLVSGHFKDELWGLAAHPVFKKYATVGDDKTLRVWDIDSCKLDSSLDLDDFGRACAYSPDGFFIAVGMGGSVGRGRRRKDGAVTVVSAVQGELRVIHQTQDAREWISDVKFSPDGKVLAVASQDNNIYLYDVQNSFELRGTCTGHSSYVAHIDFSADSQWLRSTCGAYELLFWNVNSSQQNPSGASELRDTEWATTTVTLGWPVQGIWAPCTDGTDINATDRSPDGSTLATADDFGKLKLFRYPCVQTGAAFKDFSGHSSHVTNVRWSQSGSHAITVGGNDRSVFQWVRNVEDEVDDAEDAGEDGDDSDVAGFGGIFEAEAKEVDASSGAAGGFEFKMDDTATTGDEFMATKPWLGAITAPTNPADENSAAPNVGLDLASVHGYRAVDVRENAAYNAEGEVIYHAAGVGVTYNKAAHNQRFYVGHDDDILSLTVSPDGAFVATGQQGRRPLVHVWDASTADQVCVLPRFHKRGIPTLAFSPCGRKLVSTGQDDDHSVCVWQTSNGDWSDGRKQASSANIKSKVLFAEFTTADSEFALVTGGVKHVKFWRVNGRNISAKKGIFGKAGSVQAVLTGAALDANRVATGTASGHIYIWEGRKCVRAVAGHTKCVNALWTIRNSSGEASGVVSGGKDGVVKLWDSALNVLRSYNLAETSPEPYYPAVRSVATDADGLRILVGTQGSELYEIVSDSGSTTQLIEAHCKNELWGLAPHPTDADVYATCGDDRSIRVWSVSERKLLRKTQLDTPARALAWSPDGALLAAGLGGGEKYRKSGAFVVLNAETLEPVHEGREAKEWISDIKFSPDGQTLAVGSHDNVVYLHSVGDGYSLRSRCDKHSSYITHFDFSADGSVLKTNCGGFELLYYKVATGDHDPNSSAYNDTPWQSETCVLGWPVQGIWPAAADGTDINAVHRSNSSALVATADDFGKVKLFNYPCVTPGNGSVEGKGHSSHVTNVRFTCDDGHVVTTGGNDRSVFVWRLS